MTQTPSHRPDPNANPAGDGVELTPVAATGARRTGRMIWIMVISLAAIVILFAIYLAVNAPHLQTINHPSGRDLNSHDASTYQAPPGQPRQTP